jgi:hypothetical protein
MDTTQQILAKEYILLQDVFGKKFMSIMFNNLEGYFDVRETSTFYQVRDELSNL